MFYVLLLKHWRPNIVQQVLGEVELDDANTPQYFDIEKILRWQWSSKTQRRRVFGPMARVSYRGGQVDPHVILQ